MLQPPDTEEFPINGKSLHYLVSHGYIAVPTITKDEIWDKSKADVFAKGLAMLQGGWIIISACARVSQRLPLTPLELFALAFVVSTAMSYYFWWRKPQHVGTPTVLKCEVPMAKILADAGLPADQPFIDTPMDFVEKPSQYWSRRKMFQGYDVERADGTSSKTTRQEESDEDQKDEVIEPPSSVVVSDHDRNGDDHSSPIAPDVAGRMEEDTRYISPFSSRSSTLNITTAGKKGTNGTREAVQESVSVPESTAATPTRILTEWTQEPGQLTPQDTFVPNKLSLRGSTLVVDSTEELLPRKKGLQAKGSLYSLLKKEKKLNSNSRKDSDRSDSSEKGIELETGPIHRRPTQRIPDDTYLAKRLPTRLVFLLLIPSCIHSSIHLAGWNHEFPTLIEKNVWRTATVVLAAMSCASVAVVRILGVAGYTGKHNLLWVWVNANADDRSADSSVKRAAHAVWDVVLTMASFLLILARLALIVETCIALREMPADSYVDIEWTQFIPHIS